jgi:multisubunit Na+/H+ antiporter MnhB subunit
MSTTTSARVTHPVDLAPAARRMSRATLALILAVLSVPGVTMAWDLMPGGGFVTGVPLAIAAIVLARRARRDAGPTRRTLVALVIAGLALLSVAVCTVALSV